jgi:nucleotide-binding universal stress UspA family protein
MKNILAAVDFSAIKYEVIRQAAHFAGLHSTKLWLLHIAAPHPDFVGYDIGPESVREQRAEELHGEHQWLQDKAEQLRKSGMDVTALLVQGETIDKILVECKRLAADMIVLGTQGHGTIRHLFAGSVIQGIIKDAHCPVLIIPSQ